MENYSFNCLILIIGTNPLPNYVVSEYFLKKNSNLKKIFLIYSEETKDQSSTKNYADNLSRLIKKKGFSGVDFHQIPLSNIAYSKKISEDLHKFMFEKIENTDKLHLNYTGGTKAVGISTYITLKNKYNELTCSYLDARSFRIIDDQQGYITDDLRNTVKMTLEDILELHGFVRKDGTNDDYDFSEAIKVFIDIFEKNLLDDFYKNYKRELFCEKDNPQKRLTKISKISDELKKHVVAEPFLSVIKAMPEELRIFTEEGKFKEPKNNRYLEHACKFLDGIWLELYVYEILKSTFRDLKIYNNWVIGKPEWEKNNFEIDVPVIKGYQLIGISCTTEDRKSMCKNKGFEIIHRTRQMGGDEARAILVTFMDDVTKENLEDELNIDTGGKENILVLGKNDLKKDRLIELVKNFIE